MTDIPIPIIEMTAEEMEFAEAIARYEYEIMCGVFGMTTLPKCKSCHNHIHVFPDGSHSTLCAMHTAQEMNALLDRIMDKKK